MVNLLFLSPTPLDPMQALPALELLSHTVQARTFSAPEPGAGAEPDVVVVDARHQLVPAKNTAVLVHAEHPSLPVLVLLTEGGLAGLSPVWPVADFLLDTAGPAEVEARLRLARPRQDGEDQGGEEQQVLRSGAVEIEESAYTARVGGAPLNLTFKEFELLKFLVQHTGRVFTRAQLLSEVWGYDYYGGTRTVDVHVRRLRSKLGGDHEQLIATVRNVGYSFTGPRRQSSKD